ncbi:MAG: hypothetical protein K1X53_08525, partial [Candidatus Sumerlaeaceae bacterium]|nr:hypothetical protein [Candidatus Sumerlaeaceae bacterium]
MTLFTPNLFRRWRQLAFCAALLAALVCPARADVSVDSTSIDVGDPNEIVAFDLRGDGICQILVTGANGTITVYDSKTLKRVWSKKLTDNPVTGPVIGDFLGNGANIIALADSEGNVYFLYGGDGEIAATFKISGRIAVAPSVVPLKKRDGTDRDGLVVCDDSGSVHLLSVKDKTVTEEFVVPNAFVESTDREGRERVITVGRIPRPPTIADVNGDGVPEIIIGTASGTIQATPINAPDKRIFWRAPEGTNIATSIAVGDFFHNGPALAFGTTKGDMWVLEYENEPGTTRYFHETAQQKLLGGANGDLIVSDFDGDGYMDLAGASEGIVSTFDGAGTLTNYSSYGKQPYAAAATPISHLAIAYTDKNVPRLIFCEADGKLVMMDPTLKVDPERTKASIPLQDFTIAGNLSGIGK